MNWDEVRAWRKAKRARLIAERLAPSPETRSGWSGSLIAALGPLLEGAEGPISFYWPIRGEPDLRPLMRRLAREGVALALPVVIERAAPLHFRPWAPGDKLELGIWNIPVPATKQEIVPNLLLAPVVGFTAEGYRLGYFDRTLARLRPGHAAIGVGFELGRLPTIHPQPHDIRMSRIVTEAGVVPRG